MQWHVKLYGIEWDDGNGAYDAIGLPVNLVYEVEADHEVEAIAMGMKEASDEFGFSIASTEQIMTTRV